MCSYECLNIHLRIYLLVQLLSGIIRDPQGLRLIKGMDSLSPCRRNYLQRLQGHRGKKMTTCRERDSFQLKTQTAAVKNHNIHVYLFERRKNNCFSRFIRISSALRCQVNLAFLPYSFPQEGLIPAPIRRLVSVQAPSRGTVMQEAQLSGCQSRCKPRRVSHSGDSPISGRIRRVFVLHGCPAQGVET